MYVYGKNVLKELLKNNKKINKAFIYKGFSDKFLINELQKRKIEIEFLEKKELDKLANGNHQGIILKVPNYKYFDLNELIKSSSFLIILDHLEDPHNFGAVIRTCEAFNIDGIIIPKDRSVQVNSTVMKISSGALSNIKISSVINLNQTINKLKENGFWIIGTGMKGTNYTKIDYKGKIAIVFGNEGKGLSYLVEKNCDFIATIPLFGQINSLNASVAAGIIISYANIVRWSNEI